jgi:hypothetical protein
MVCTKKKEFQFGKFSIRALFMVMVLKTYKCFKIIIYNMVNNHYTYNSNNLNHKSFLISQLILLTCFEPNENTKNV